MSELRQRQPRVECPAFLAFVRRKPCCACGAPAPSQAAHLRMTDPRYPQKRAVGIGERPDDSWATPLCASCHLDGPQAQHKITERLFWKLVRIDSFKLATDLYAQFERRRKRTPEHRERVVKRAASQKLAKVRREKRKHTFVHSNPAWKPARATAFFPGGQKIRSANRLPKKGQRKFNRRKS